MEYPELTEALRGLAEALRSLADTTHALIWHSRLQGYALILLTIITLAGFGWMALELRTRRTLRRREP